MSVLSVLRMTAMAMGLAAIGVVGGYNIAATIAPHESTRGVDLSAASVPHESTRGVDLPATVVPRGLDLPGWDYALERQHESTRSINSAPSGDLKIWDASNGQQEPK